MVTDAATNSWRAHPAGATFGNWQTADGWTLRRMDWLQPAGSQARGSLLFAGGRGDFIEKYLEAFADWHRRGWNVASFDWRGQGRSRGDIVGGNVDSFDPLIGDLAGLIEDWRGQHPGPHVAIGHSMGGHLLLRTIVERKPALDAAILVAPMILPNGAPIPSWLAPGVADAMCRLGLRAQPLWKVPTGFKRPGSRRQLLLTSSRERYEDELHWWREEPGLNLGLPSWGWMRAAFRSAEQAFAPGRLATVHLPILILGTDIDRLVSPQAIRRVAGQLPNATLHMYPDAAHEILREADSIRRDALERIDAFLGRFAG